VGETVITLVKSWDGVAKIGIDAPADVPILWLDGPDVDKRGEPDVP